MGRFTWTVASCFPLIASLVACSGTDGGAVGTSDLVVPPEGTLPGTGGTGNGTTQTSPTPGPAPEGGGAAEPTGPAVKRVFVTAKRFTGNLKKDGAAADGFAGGDKLCAAEATAAKLGGTWKAYLSGRVDRKAVNAPDRFEGVGPWHLVDGKTKVFADKAALKGDALVKVDMLADGKRVTTVPAAWTGTRSGVAAGTNCESNGSSWSSTNGNGINGQPLEPKNWDDDGSTKNCNEQAPLYCFEQ